MGKFQVNLNRVAGLFGVILVFTSLILPPLAILPGLPKFHASELLLPALFVLVIVPAGREQLAVLTSDLKIQVCLVAIIVFSMFCNGRLGVIRDWFEIIELFKYVVLLGFFTRYVHLMHFDKLMHSVFIGLVAFNVFHYFDVLDFNQRIEVYYGSEIQVNTFGLNSLGKPDTKRLLGTLGNPNNNAVLFIFFSIYFFPKRNDFWINILFFLVASSFLLMCQSRTTTAAFAILFLAAAYLRELKLTQTLVYAAGFGFVYWLMFKGGNTYLSTMANNPVKETSVTGRMQTFRILCKMILQSPFTGHGANKEFFDANKLNSDNEYILYTWRYGIFGLIAYLFWLGRLVFLGWKSRFSNEGFCLFLFSCAIGISALTNSPLNNPYLLFLLTIFAGMYFNRLIRERI